MSPGRRWSSTFSRVRSEEHTSELQSPYVISYAVFCLKKTQQQLAAHISPTHPLQQPRLRAEPLGSCACACGVGGGSTSSVRVFFFCFFYATRPPTTPPPPPPPRIVTP